MELKQCGLDEQPPCLTEMSIAEISSVSGFVCS